jgi:zinc/manganese transport system substrate-binding protein
MFQIGLIGGSEMSVHTRHKSLFASAVVIGSLCMSLTSTAAAAPKINVVAAENCYGDLANQIGGDHVQVTSIMSDPNVDPHEYEADPKDAQAVAKANVVIQNGDDYDNWMPRLLKASPNPARVELTGAEIGHDKLKENPHIWYSLDDIRAVADSVAKTYEKLDSADKEDFEKNLKKFDDSLKPIQDEMDAIAKEFPDTPVGLTETIYLYQTPRHGRWQRPAGC